MRDKIKDIEYFNDFISEDLERVKKFTDKLVNGEVKTERIIPVRAKIHDLKLGIIIAKYSRGDDVCLLKKDFSVLIDEWEKVWEPEFYNKNLRMISLGILFGLDTVYARRIKKLLKDSNIADWLLHFLLDSWNGEQADENLRMLFPNAFNTLKKAVSEENKVESLKKYLSDDWYNEDCGCYEAHKSKQNIYYGYWSFEAGAIAKILNLDDSSLKDVPYYPYDLVHYKE